MPRIDLKQARDIYYKTRDLWFADSVLDAHERLGLITVAARLRKFAFFNHLRSKEETALFLSSLGLHSHVQSVCFDVNVEAHSISVRSKEAYVTAKKNDGFLGVAVWLSNNRPDGQLTLTQLGTALEYPLCCVAMDVHTKEEEHRLSLEALIEDFGDHPSQIADALERGYPIEKPYPCFQEWDRRFRLTMARFPFVLHTACDGCLADSGSPSAALNSAYEKLAKEVSDELHFLVRWAARIISGGSDR